MGMSPRLLRPRASGFDPRSISGLAAWYDASDSSTLYQTDAGNVTAVSSPLDIAGCLCWYDASDATSITQSGGLVSQWNDKSGNNRHATASGSLRPTSGGSQNGRTVMQFTGTQAMTITGNFLQLQNVTMLAVASKNTNHYGGIISSAPTNPEDSPVLAFYLTSIAFINRRQVVQTTTGNNVYRIISGQSEGTAQRAWADGVRGVDAVASASLHTSNTITKIGVLRTGDTADLNGNIAEIICYSGALSTADRARIEKYLAAKWGISNVHTQATAVGNTVGAWLDKSGNGRNVTQPTTLSQPIVASEAGRTALAFDGVNDQLTHTLSSTVGANAVSLVAVARNNMTSQPTFLTAPVDLSSGNNGRPITRWEGGGGFNNRLFVGTLYVDITNIFKARSTRFVQVFTGERDALGSGTHRVREFFDGGDTAGGGITVTWSTASQVVAIGARADLGTIYKGNICEVLIYDKVLSSSERRRIEAYLSAKWTTPLAPQVSNADAQNWIDRVYGNAGTVSQSTAQAVNAFCDAVDAAGLREKFLRLNLFCGSNLNAALVPLYRNWRAYASRNLLSVRDDVTQSGWTKSGATAAFSASQRPFAYGPYANIVTANAATGTTPHIASTAGNYGYGKVTVSAYLKANGQNTVRLLLVGSSGMTFPGGGTVAYVNINLANGTTSNLLAGTTVNVTSVGNGWYRLAYTCDNNWAGNMTIRFDVGDGSSYNPTGSESFFIWGIQSEINATATDFDPFPAGNALDTNNGPFVSGDYVETGITGGLKANGTNKYLNTGMSGALLLPGDRHVSAYEIVNATTDYSPSVMSGNAGASTHAIGPWTAQNQYRYRTHNTVGGAALGTTAVGHWLGNDLSTTASDLYKNAAIAGSTSGQPAGGSGNTNYFIFGSPGLEFSEARLGGYSIGLSLTAQQVANFYNAMQAFQTALSRNV